MDAAFAAFENNLIIHKRYPKWYDYGEKETKRAMELYQRGYFYALAERDEFGRRTVIERLSRLDPDYFNADDAMR